MKISIAMAVYNGEKYIFEQIESILEQSFDDFELVIQDDCSTDTTYDLLCKIAERDSRIKLFRNDKQLGVVKNFEKAIGRCKGEYIALSDQDDIWRADKLKIEIEKMRELERRYPDKAIMVHSDLEVIDENRKVISDSFMRQRGYRLDDKRNLPHILGPNGVMGNTIMMNRRAVESVTPFPADIAVHDYWIAVMTELFGIRGYIPEPLVKYRIHGYNSSNSIDRYGVRGMYGNIKSFFRGEVKLPYMNTGRERVLEAVLSSYDIEPTDRKYIEIFLDYLHMRKNRIEIFYKMVKSDMFRSGPIYRTALLPAILLYKKK